MKAKGGASWNKKVNEKGSQKNIALNIYSRGASKDRVTGASGVQKEERGGNKERIKKEGEIERILGSGFFQAE